MIPVEEVIEQVEHERIAATLAEGRPSCKRPEIRAPVLDAVAAAPDRDWSLVVETIEARWTRRTLLSRSTLHELGTRRARTLTTLLGGDR